jgi:hypothetical protein
LCGFVKAEPVNVEHGDLHAGEALDLLTHGGHPFA